MANLSSIARPYALAAFQYARETEQCVKWRNFLDGAAKITQSSAMMRLLNDPLVATQDILKIYSDLLLPLDASQKNFLTLLSQNKRFLALPEINEAFLQHEASFQKSSTVKLITATKTTNEFQTSLAAALKKRTQHDIILKCDIDPSIIGGAIIRIGDRVIDASIRGKLNRLLETLTD